MSDFRIEVTQVTSNEAVNEAASFVTGNKVRVPLKKWLASEHSPIRDLIFKIDFYGIKNYVAAHLKTYNRDVISNITESNRRDYAAKYGKQVSDDRETPTNHHMMLNAAAMIKISRDRICNEASVDTIKVWRAVREEVRKINPEMALFMVPECVYRNGLCPHFHSKCHYFNTNKFKEELEIYKQSFRYEGKGQVDKSDNIERGRHTVV